MKAIIKKVGEKPQAIELSSGSIEELQAAVGGYVETVNCGGGVMLLCDEEGKIKNKPYNFDLGSEIIVGDVLFVQNGGNGEFTDLTDASVLVVMNYFDRTPYTT